jgi:hypothetical protein
MLGAIIADSNQQVHTRHGAMRQRGAGDTDRNQKHVDRTVKGVSREREAQLVIVVSVVSVGVRGDRVIVCEHVVGAPRKGEDCGPMPDESTMGECKRH